MAYQDQETMNKRVRASSVADIYDYMEREQEGIVNKVGNLS